MPTKAIVEDDYTVVHFDVTVLGNGTSSLTGGDSSAVTTQRERPWRKSAER